MPTSVIKATTATRGRPTKRPAPLRVEHVAGYAGPWEQRHAVGDRADRAVDRTGHSYRSAQRDDVSIDPASDGHAAVDDDHVPHGPLARHLHVAGDHGVRDALILLGQVLGSFDAEPVLAIRTNPRPARG
jgi:hypothetical protein